ncbi:MAG: hypothetical protein SGILL_007435 [Bacillariaceae sp.]
MATALGQQQGRKPRQHVSFASSLEGKWILLLTLSFAVFGYMVIVTEVLHLTPAPDGLTSHKEHEKLQGFVESSEKGTEKGHGDNYFQQQEHSGTQQQKQDTFVEAGTTSHKYDTHDNEESTVEEKHIPRRKKNSKLRKERKKKQQEKQAVNASEIDLSKYTFAEPAPQPNVSNMEFYNVSSDGEFNLWDNNPTLPYWMKSYFNWHKWKRKTWDLDDWESERWMIAQCLMDQDKRKCGGTSDRLKPIPTLLRMAYDTKRILLIRWTRPSMLEDFLMPPEGGFDWRVPPGLLPVVNNVTHGKKLTPFKMIRKYTHSGMSVVRVKYQTNSPESTYRDLIAQDANETFSDYALRKKVELPNQPGFDEVFHNVWRIFFTPSIAVANLIQSKLNQMGLLPNHYVAAHLRAMYAVEKREDSHIQLFTENALACATQLRPGVPIFFASDSSVASDHAVMLGETKYIPNQGKHHRPNHDDNLVATALDKGVVRSIPNPNPPWHLDTMIGPVEKFYDTFVDLYLMALAGCVTHGIGGYGHWALLIGGNINCTLRQEFMGQRPFVRNACHFQAPDEKTKDAEDRLLSNTKASNTRLDTLFLPPMKNSVDGYASKTR